MFDNYVGAKTAKRSKWVAGLLGLSIVLNATAASALVVRSLWVIEKLEPPDTELALSAPPPPPPPPPAGSSKPKSEVKKTIKKVKDTVQPDATKKAEPDDSSDTDSGEEGVEGGVEGGVAGGVVGGVLGGQVGGVLGGVGDAPPPPKAEDEPKIVPQVALEAQRISGEKLIQPPNDVATAISRSGKSAVGVFKMCLSAGGTVSKISQIKSTGHPSYDSKIKSEMRKWRYSAFKVNGRAVPVCTSVTFIYKPAS